MVIQSKSGIAQPTTHASGGSIVPRVRPGSVLLSDVTAPKIARHELPGIHSTPDLPAASNDAVVVNDLRISEHSSIRPVGLSLDHYRLKTPSKLPAADAQGLRFYSGRQFVDVAPGEVVQVRQNTATGEHRATLASEWVASGPVLVLDRQTMVWTLKKPSIVSEIDNDLNALPHHQPGRPDSSGDRRSQTQAGKLYEGLNDKFERTASQRMTILARGLEQFAAQHLADTRLLLKATGQIFFDASNAIRANYADAEHIFEGYFGQSHALVTERLSDGIFRGQALSVEYQGVWGLDKFVAVEGDLSRRAWIYEGDFHGRIFINVDHIHGGDLPEILGHEMLHTRRVNRFKSVGPSTVDFFYLSPFAQHELKHAVPVYDIAERGISEVIMQGGLTVNYLKAFGSDQESFKSGVSEHAGLPPSLDIHTAVDVFNANPDVRAQMAARNADSIIYAAKSLQQLHHARVAANQLLNSLIND